MRTMFIQHDDCHTVIKPATAPIAQDRRKIGGKVVLLEKVGAHLFVVSMKTGAKVDTPAPHTQSLVLAYENARLMCL